MRSVYLLGAGATRALCPNAPLMRELLPAGLQEFAGNSRIERVRGFINDFFFQAESSRDSSGVAFPRLGDVLTIIDSAIYENRPFSVAYTVPKLQEIRDDIVYLISRLLDSRLGDFESRSMDDFVEKLAPEDTIISLNYDIIADNALLKRYEQLLRQYKVLNYGTELRFLYWRYPEGDYWRGLLHTEESSPALYKLHGSLNWLYCPSCQALDVTLGEKGAMRVFSDFPERARCFLCRHVYEPLIITPTFLKSYANGLLVEIWRRAEEALLMADHIVFIGYSLPDADIHIKVMVKRAIFNNTFCRNELGPSIMVVDVEPSGGELEQRFRRLFGRKLKYSEEGFEEYIKQMSGSTENPRGT